MNSTSINMVIFGHFLIGFYFAFFGIWNIYHWSRIIGIMAQKGIPHPYLLLPIGIGWQTIAGGMIMFGMFPKLAALSLVPFTLVAIVIFHPFWNFKGEHKLLDFTIFITNLTVVIGSLFLIMAPLNQLRDLLM